MGGCICDIGNPTPSNLRHLETKSYEIKISNYEIKIGFQEIRHLLMERCLSTLGKEKVNQLMPLFVASEINKLLNEVKE